MKEEIILTILTVITIGVMISYTYEVFFVPKPPIKIEQYKFQDGTMTQKKKTKHEGNEGTVGFWLYMKALYKDGI